MLLFQENWVFIGLQDEREGDLAAGLTDCAHRSVASLNKVSHKIFYGYSVTTNRRRSLCYIGCEFRSSSVIVHVAKLTKTYHPVCLLTRWLHTLNSHLLNYALKFTWHNSTTCKQEVKRICRKTHLYIVSSATPITCCKILLNRLIDRSIDWWVKLLHST